MGLVRSPTYGTYTYDGFIPVPTSAYTYGTDASDLDRRNAAESFVFNSMMPYMKSVDMLADGGIQNAVKGSFSMTPAANKGAGGVNLPANMKYYSYTYNGVITGMGSGTFASPANLVVFWHGMGKRGAYGHMYASPNLVCDDLNAACQYVAPKADCAGGAGHNGETSFYTTNTTKTGWDVFNGGVIMAFADSHAKFRKLALNKLTTTPTAAQTDPRIDPFPAYKGNFAAGRWWSGVGGKACHAYMFRPEFDPGNASDPAIVTLPDGKDL